MARFVVDHQAAVLLRHRHQAVMPCSCGLCSWCRSIPRSILRRHRLKQRLRQRRSLLTSSPWRPAGLPSRLRRCTRTCCRRCSSRRWPRTWTSRGRRMRSQRPACTRRRPSWSLATPSAPRTTSPLRLPVSGYGPVVMFRATVQDDLHEGIDVLGLGFAGTQKHTGCLHMATGTHSVLCLPHRTPNVCWRPSRRTCAAATRSWRTR